MDDQEVKFILNDLADAVKKLTDMVEEINPGATKDVSFLRFIADRISRSLSQISSPF